MRHVQQIKRCDGRVDLYLRKKGAPSIRLTNPLPPPGEEAGSPLAREVEGLLKALEPAAALPGTLREAARDYELRSAEFGALAASTRELYLPILRELNETLGPVPIAAFTPAYVLRLRDGWAKRGHRCANLRRQLLKNVLKGSLIAGTLEKDPFALVGQARRPASLAEPHILWPAEVVEVVIAAAVGSRRYGIARAVALARYVGARRGDLVRLHDRNIRQGRVAFLSGKKRVPVDAPIDPELTHWLATIPSTQPEEPRRGRRAKRDGGEDVRRMPATTLIFNLLNQRYTEDGLGQELRKLVEDLHAQGLIASAAFDLHGLRHTRGVELALAGCTDAQGAAMLGHASPSSFAQYRRQADRIRMADDGADKVLILRARDAQAGVKQQVEQSVTAVAKNE